MTSRWVVPAAGLGLLLFAASAEAKTRSFVTLRDDGTIAAKKLTSPDAISESVMKAYDASGAKRPEVISLWTTFPMDGNTVETLFDPLGNDVQGIGLEDAYGGTGVFDSAYAPTRAILLHNDVTALAARAQVQSAPLEGFARYLFLLELSHMWGPAPKLPVTDGGPPANGLIGFDFHWSFWMDAGGSASGGNIWKDNGDGTFTTTGQLPSKIHYSMLDLYLQGLADPSEVLPFGLLVNPVPPADVKDPFSKGAYSAASFPWFGTAPFTATATRRTITIEDITAANGARMPARASGMMDLGIVLLVEQDATDEQIAALEETFEPIAETLAPAYHDATQARGTMNVLTASDTAPAEDAGVDDAATPSTPAAPATTTETSGCGVAPGEPGAAMALALGVIAACVLARRRVAR